MSQAFAYHPVEPAPQRKRRFRLLLVPLVIAFVLIGIPGAIFGYAQSELAQAQASEAANQYAQALSQFQTVETVAGNPVTGLLLGELSDKARIGTAETHFLWGSQLKQQAHYDDAETQLRAAVKSGIADWQTRANEGLADLFVSWGQSLVTDQKFQAGIDKYRMVAGFDQSGNLTAKTNAVLATAYAAYADFFTKAQPADYPSAVSWYRDLVKMFPESPGGQAGAAHPIAGGSPQLGPGLREERAVPASPRRHEPARAVVSNHSLGGASKGRARRTADPEPVS